MDVNKLVRMANQIAANFDTGSDPDKAAAGVADHLKRFWTPSMKREIVEFRNAGKPGLADVADQAVARLAEELESPA